MSCVTCHIPNATCHMSPVTNVNSHSQRPSPCPLYTVGRFANTHKPKKIKTQKLFKWQRSKHVQRYGKISDTLFDQQSTVHTKWIFRDSTHTYTHGHCVLETESGRCCEITHTGNLLFYQSMKELFIKQKKRKKNVLLLVFVRTSFLSQLA